MRDADKRSLIFQATNCFLWRQSFWNLLANKCSQDLSFGCHDLLPYDDQLRVELLRLPRARNRVVIGHYDAVNSLAATCRDELRGRREGVFGVDGVTVEFNIQHKGKFTSVPSSIKGF